MPALNVDVTHVRGQLGAADKCAAATAQLRAAEMGEGLAEPL